MPRLFLVTCIAFSLLTASAQAECKDLKQFIKDETAGAEKYVDTFSFRHDHRADSVLMLVKASVEKGRLPKRWLFLHRDDPASTDLCVRSRGETFGQHDSMPENASAANFGPPGSGYPRCAQSRADAADQLRLWANRDLGDSVILYTAATDTPGYQFVIGPNQDWIIIEDQSPQQSCYFDRGTDVFMRFNITVQP